jgi:hypothetical protein
VSLPYSRFNKRPTFSTKNTATLMAVMRGNTFEWAVKERNLIH